MSEIQANIAVEEELTPLAPKPRTLWRDAWSRIRRNRMAIAAMVIFGLYVLVALIGFTGILNEPIKAAVGPSYAAPSTEKISLLLGTDFLGRSVLWRLLYGARVALTVAISASILSICIGTVLGLMAGFFGGMIDQMIIWLFSTVSSIPGIVLLMALAFVLKGQQFMWGDKAITLTGVPTIILAMGLTSWVGLCRYVRAEAIRLRDRDFVTAARAIGLPNWMILFRHILPNVFHLIIISFSLGLAGFVQAEVVLSFLGLGVTDQPSWGRMIDDAKLELLKGVWWQMAAATVTIFVFSLAVNMLGDALRDALDPRLRGVD